LSKVLSKLGLLAVALAGVIRRKNDRFGLVVGSLVSACEPNLVVGKWDCQAAGGQGSTQEVNAPVAVPWSTSFEDAFCDYNAVAGYCYAAKRASYDTVTMPVHSGKSAAAFSVIADDGFDGYQARCVRRGQLPSAASYSAFFFIPSAPTAAANWNLIHFRGGVADGSPLHGLWDVSLARQADGTFQVFVFDFLNAPNGMTRATTASAVPIGSWFQLEVHLERAADASGRFAVYQDGELALSLTNVVTDNTSYGEWYVGNLAASLTPPESILYVDDVAIREAP
jgi:hypothetical protein